MLKTLSFYKVDDFKKYFSVHKTASGNPTYVPTIQDLTDDTWTYDDTLKGARVKSKNVKGAIHVPLGELKVGDKVEVELEVLNYSGIKAKVALDLTNSDFSGYATTTLAQIQSTEYNVIETLGFTCVVQQDGYGVATIGLYTSDVGEFLMRRGQIKINNSVYPISQGLAYIPSVRVYPFKIISGVFSLDKTLTKDTCSFTQTNNSTITVTHDYPFTMPTNLSSGGEGVVIAQVGNYGSNKFSQVKIQSQRPNSFIMQFYDENNNVLDVSTVTEMYINVVHHGWDRA